MARGRGLCGLAVIAAVALACAGVANGDKAADKIDPAKLPGLPDTPDFDQYAGYVTVDEAHGRALFYWLTEAASAAPANAPLVLWLNGGPGCSSVGGGLMSELGPYFPDAQGKLMKNKYAWNNVANVVFLESPAGVGFSYSNTTSDYKTGDAQTAEDSWQFLQGFLMRFPEFQGRDFWITGESYGGHYVPTLANAIVNKNNAKAGLNINLKGFLVGNAWTNATADNTGSAFDWWSHSLVAKETYEGILDNCNMSHIGPLAEQAEEDVALADDDNSKCEQFQTLAFDSFDAINIYDVYADVCLSARSATAEAHRLLYALGRSREDRSQAELQHLKAAVSTDDDGNTEAGGRKGYDPCIGSEVVTYLNQRAVQAAIHANTSGTLPGPWSTCSSVVDYSRFDLLTSMIPVYEDLLKAGISVNVYSGDVDGIVPTTGTKIWLDSLNLGVKDPFRAWKTDNGQTGGFVEVFDGLQFITVRNAGHMVPYAQPSRALHMLTHVLNGQPL